MAQSLADPLATFAAHAASGLGVRLRSLPGGKFRMEIAEQEDAWTSFHAGHQGFDSPGEAIAATDERITGWKAARSDAENAEIVAFWDSDRLERRQIMIDGESGPVEVRGYAARTADGEWVEAVSPRDAVKKAKARESEQAAARGTAQERQ